jgi:FMN phosphatase YigB (HAD superfamily)
MIKLIGFDLDNTLWPVKPAILKAEAALTAVFQNPPS